MNLLRILRFSPLVGVLVLLLASCGTHATVSGTSFNTPSTGSTTGPPTGAPVAPAVRRPRAPGQSLHSHLPMGFRYRLQGCRPAAATKQE